MRLGRLLIGVAVLAVGFGCGPLRGTSGRPHPPPPPRLLDFEATAYSITGTTASGSQARRGIVAADRTVLPLGSRIRVHDAGAYSGEYTVADTGPAVNGREIEGAGCTSRYSSHRIGGVAARRRPRRTTRALTRA